ncbi:hypothetical protein [Chondromyces apiculatus]|uniref:Lipoprotein n=1 Tax=Chondromyces apiculatus DSM 436 TaxID=1192034 RepID=A0A017TJ45_9BACT|nr:hypothetical protein [Chondromyces apiculatus]EYF08626.1 Hypothetical protein CAP_4156 [Chondromyces apiculatus DSM 436]
MSNAPARMFHAVVVLGTALTACDRAGGSSPVQEPRTDTGAGPDAQAAPGKVRRLKTGQVIPADSPCRDGAEMPYPPCFYIR